MALTPSQVRDAKPKAARYDLRDTGMVEGLLLRVNPGGKRVWYVVFDVGGSRRTHRLGEFPQLSLAQARNAARRVRLDLVDGKDPAAARREAKAKAAKAVTVAEVVERYLEAKREKKTVYEDERYLRTALADRVGDMPAADVDRATIAEALDVYQRQGKTTAANRCRASLHAMFRWAQLQGVVDANPVGGVPRPNKERRRSRWLTDYELGRLWRGLDEAPAAAEICDAIRLLLLTGCRRGEVTAACWREISLHDRVWIVPGARMKSGNEHLVPLSTQAVAVLGRIHAASAGAEHVFRSHRTGEAIRADSVTQGLSRIVPALGLDPFTLHDIRRSVATGMQRLGTAPHIIAAALAHTPRDVTHWHYALHSFVEERRQALQAWGDHLEGVGDE